MHYSSIDNGAVRAFGPGYFCYFALVLDPRHIGTMPKASVFWSRLQRTGAILIFYNYLWLKLLVAWTLFLEIPYLVLISSGFRTTWLFLQLCVFLGANQVLNMCILIKILNPNPFLFSRLLIDLELKIPKSAILVYWFSRV